MNKLSVIVTYNKNVDNLAVLLVLLQQQTLKPSEIIVVDTSENKSGLEIAKKFKLPLQDMKVICGKFGVYEAWNKGIKQIKSNNDVLVLNDDLLIQPNLLESLLTVSNSINNSLSERVLALFPITSEKEHCSQCIDYSYSLDTSNESIKYDLSPQKWMPGFCFYLTRECVDEVGLFDTDYKIWFGDDDYQKRIFNTAIRLSGHRYRYMPFCKVLNTEVFHFGGKSYEYASKDVQKIIDIDRRLFERKHYGK